MFSQELKKIKEDLQKAADIINSLPEDEQERKAKLKNVRLILAETLNEVSDLTKSHRNQIPKETKRAREICQKFGILPADKTGSRFDQLTLF